jgi:hypothetical protein
VADVYYRFVRGPRATLDDFRSQGALGRKLRSHGDERAFHEGVSVYDNFDQACEVPTAIRFRRGSYLAAVALPAGYEVEVVQTGLNPHYFTVFAEAELLLSLVMGDPTLMPGAPER